MLNFKEYNRDSYRIFEYMKQATYESWLAKFPGGYWTQCIRTIPTGDRHVVVSYRDQPRREIEVSEDMYERVVENGLSCFLEEVEAWYIAEGFEKIEDRQWRKK